MIALTAAQLDAWAAAGDWESIELASRYISDPYYSFQPRANCPAEYDEQSAFIDDKTSRFAICLGGNASGKTVAAAHKTARYVLETRPMREHCPFWVIGDTLEKVCGVCWVEKLSHIIPRTSISSISWNSRSRGWPKSVMLKHPDDSSKVGWMLEFKSYEQGLSSMKSSSIGGFWFNEEVPYSIVIETRARCREYNSPGWADFTPLEVKSPEWLDLYESPPSDWRFYHLNTKKNTALAPGWYESFIKDVPEDMRDVRSIGTFATLSGQVFKEWRESVHVIPSFHIPRDWHHLRGIDFGYNNPFCCLWVARDPDGRYYVYDEHYYARRLNDYHAAEINHRTWPDNHPCYGRTFSDHDAQQRAELGNYGIFCTPARKEPKNASIELLRSHLMVKDDGKPKLFVFDHCVNLRREMRSYRWPEGVGGKNPRNPRDEPLDKDDHSVDSLRYVIYSDYVTRHGRMVPLLQTIRPDPYKHGALTALKGRR